MINALVVDDERMVRKGLLSLTNWEDYNMLFIGEAKDGVQALQFLSKQSVDVMFVDITMPNMTGFELMKRVQQQYPDIEFVILTCHHEFDYVQEALQLGAIDYIVKTLLNRDNVDEIATRIMSRLKRDKQKKNQELMSTFNGGIYYFLKHQEEKATRYEHHAISIPYTEISKGIVKFDKESYLQLSLSDKSSLLQVGYIVHVSCAEKLQASDIEVWLKQYFLNYVFYNDHDSELFISEEQITTIVAMEAKRNPNDSQLKLWQDQLEQYRWLLYPQDWSSWQRSTMQLQPDPTIIISSIHQMYSQLVLHLQWRENALAAPLLAPDTTNWYSIEKWITQLSLQLRSRMTDLSLSHEVVICMIKAIQYMHRQIGMDLNQNDVAYQIGMSRSYFSQCFKRFFGISFGEVLRTLRIETAKQLLVSSHKSISEIANSIGFDDHKYFSRTFKAQLGMYPTEYRSLHFEVR